MRFLYFSMLIIAVGCGKKRAAPEQQPPVADEVVLGYLSHTADVFKVKEAVLALRCKRPALSAPEFTVTDVRQFELRLPKGGVGCQVMIKALVLNGQRFEQDPHSDYDWSEGGVVDLFGQLGAEHLVRVQIEKQLPETLAADRHANRFLFRVSKFRDDARVINTSVGLPLSTGVRGLALTTWIARGAQVLPSSPFLYQPAVSNNPYLPTRQMHFAFSCVGASGRASIVEDKLVCGQDMYRKLSFAMVRGVINPESARAGSICNRWRMTALPLRGTVISLPRQQMRQHVSALVTIVLRSEYLDTERGEFRHSCHLYPLAPHFASWMDGYRPRHAL